MSAEIIDFRFLQMQALARQIAKARAAGDGQVVDELLLEAELVFNALKRERLGEIDLAARAREEWGT
jgi:hypothetical protein